MAPSVRRSGSPGPAPTKITRPRVLDELEELEVLVEESEEVEGVAAD